MKNWLECIPFIEFAYNRAQHSATKMSPFQVVYGFNPTTPLDLTPLPPAEAVSLVGEEKAAFIKQLHQKARENLEKRTEQYAKQANKGRKEVVFQPGEWVWLHLRKERFPDQRSSKLKPRGDGPFKVIERINNNAYRLELPGELNVSSTFNVTDLAPFLADENILETKSIQEGGNDEDISTEPDLTEPQMQEVDIPVPNKGVITRQRARALQDKYNQAILRAMNDSKEGGPSLLAKAAWDDTKEILGAMDPTRIQESWPLLSREAHANVFVITTCGDSI